MKSANYYYTKVREEKCRLLVLFRDPFWSHTQESDWEDDSVSHLHPFPSASGLNSLFQLDPAQDAMKTCADVWHIGVLMNPVELLIGLEVKVCVSVVVIL